MGASTLFLTSIWFYVNADLYVSLCMSFTGLSHELVCNYLHLHLLCARACVYVRACSLQHVVSLWLRQWEGQQGRLITESEGTSHPPPLFLPGPKEEYGLLQHTLTRARHTHAQAVKCLTRKQGIESFHI